MFIGVYDYTVILTYLSLFSSVFGILFSIHGYFVPAIFCLTLSGVCDAFDGRVARTKKNRTEDEKNFGIQLDSLCDVICFGLFPSVFCYLLGMNSPVGCVIITFYSLCAVIRLAFFNVMEAKRQRNEDGCAKIYHGLPVTSISIILPVAFFLQDFMPFSYFLIGLHIVMLVTGFLFILNFKLRKPSLKTVLTIMAVSAIVIFSLFTYSKLTHKNKENTKPTVTEAVYETEIA